MSSVHFAKGLILVYSQSFGNMYLEDTNDVRIAIGKGYSGSHLGGRNNAIFEAVKRKGPIPRGRWSVEAPTKHPALGPVAFRLTPSGHSAFGRTGFLIHGDNRAGNGSASEGCIILDRVTRDVIAALYRGGVRLLDVVD